MNDELIMNVASLISEGKGAELEEAIRKIQGKSTNAEDNVANDDVHPASCSNDYDEENGYDDYDGKDEYDDPIVRHDISDCLANLQPMVNAVGSKNILTIPIPTVYGMAMFVDMSKYDYSVTRMNNLFDGDFCVLPVSLDVIAYGDEYSNEALVYKPEYDDHKVDYAIVIPKQYINKDVGYIFPIAGSYAGMGGVATDPVDMVHAVRSLYAVIDDTITLPVIGYKVTKPDGTCKGMEYEPMQYYKTDGEIVMHHSGFHFAMYPQRLKTWYRGPYENNIPWLVQAGPRVESDDSGVSVSNGIIFIKELNWEDIG